LEFSVPFQHKYGYITDDLDGILLNFSATWVTCKNRLQTFQKTRPAEQKAKVVVILVVVGAAAAAVAIKD